MLDVINDLEVLESNELKTGKFIYDLKSTKRGFCYIMNNSQYSNSEHTRIGSEVDTKLLSHVFKNLNFEVLENTDLSANEIISSLKAIKRRNLELGSHDAFIAIFSAHGKLDYNNECVIIGTDMIPVKIKAIIEMFNNENCKQLQTKPKLFVFNACRGEKLDEGILMESDEESDDDMGNKDSHVLKLCPTYEDILIIYSTISGFSSIRDINEGTWFGLIMAQSIGEYAKDHDLEFILKIIQNKIREKTGNKSGSLIKQSISWEAWGWRKLLFFNPGFPKLDQN